MICVEQQQPKSVASSISLEDEILYLRDEMVRMFQQEESLTSDLVVEISCQLDLKINEYMKSYYVKKSFKSLHSG
ncbi:aspartyl-phosphate phosphatase Spo0E family protein [Paenibacillus massiliensis]|uniref:aspartyl-phosphate phosphatase Spo0E family protein n=1 Tax=Paenibacillus massiliensis TaxID=225917 RepID=UPI00035DD9CB|nr:aspartyl-phosphate phosphatase Spo0E family protein [Paenibacillus massiliensis]